MKFILSCVMAAFFSFAGTTVHAQAEVEGALLEALGTVSGVLIYNTYMVIGSVADGYQADAYDSLDVKTYMEEQIGILTTIAEQYKSLNNNGHIADPSDQKTIVEFAEVCSLLKTQATALNKYVDSPTDENAKVFQEHRTKSWERIATLLGIE